MARRPALVEFGSTPAHRVDAGLRQTIFQPMTEDAPAGLVGARRVTFLTAGPVAYVLLFLVAPSELGRPAAHVLGVAAWMAIWWLSEAVPLGATALLPLTLFPSLGVASMRDAAAPYGNEVVFLFLSGFLLAAALERWQAHARVAYGMVAAIGTGGRRVVLGVMVATAVISMWISNTATTMMMYPIALAIGGLFGRGEGEGDEAADERSVRNMRAALMLGVAYAASIGGMGTLVGTPPNLVFAAAAEELSGQRVGFVDFMMVGAPIVVLLLPVCWALLVFVLHPGRVSLGAGARQALVEQRAALGRLRGGEALTLAVFALTVLGWLFRERKDVEGFVIPGLVDVVPGVTDASIGITGALLLFVLTGRAPDGSRHPLLTWREVRALPWEVLLLVGGGLSLAAAIESSGLAGWLGGLMTGLSGYPTLIIFAGLAVIVLVLSELASNTAVATMMMPIAASLAGAIGRPPLELMLVAALAASTGFALPAATPPNTIAVGSGYVTVRQLARAGVVLDVIAVGMIVVVVALLYPLVFG